MIDPLQSVYRKFHLTESALLKIQNDIAISPNKGQVTALTLLDLSICHTTLTDMLANWCGVSGVHVNTGRTPSAG